MRTKTSFIPAVLAIFLSFFWAMTVNSDVTATLEESGNDLLIQYSGSLDLNDLQRAAVGQPSNNLVSGAVAVGGTPYESLGFSGGGGQDIPADIYCADTRPTTLSNIDIDIQTPDSPTTGDPFGVLWLSEVYDAFCTSATLMVVEAGYQSGDPIEGTVTFPGYSLESLSLVADEFVWTAGPNTITLRVEASPPQSSVPVTTMPMYLLFALSGLLALFGFSRVRASK